MHTLTQPLPDGRTTLADVLSAQGFLSAAFVSAFPLRRELGLDQGFSLYEDSFQKARSDRNQRSAGETNERIRAWLEENRNRERVFSLGPLF